MAFEGSMEKPKPRTFDEVKAAALAGAAKKEEKIREAQERARISPEEKKERLEKLLRETALGLRRAGFLVDDECRVQMEGFRGVKGDAQVERDLKYVRDIELAIARNMESDAERRIKFRQEARRTDQEVLAWAEIERRSADGTKFEVLATIVFNKLLGPDFYTIRTSRFDDLAAGHQIGVDNLIIERATGNVVGAFDEVVEVDSGRRQRLHEKTEKILEQNFRGGVKINYGFEVENGGKVVRPAKAITEIPVFHLTLTKSELEAGLSSLGTSSEVEQEERLLKRFIISIGAQIDHLMAREAALRPSLKSKLDLFSRKLGEVEGRLAS